jgi:hypothetical protein
MNRRQPPVSTTDWSADSIDDHDLGHARMLPGEAVTPPDDDGFMTNQLILVDASTNDFRLDERTREIGRAGIAAARQALAEAVRRSAEAEPVAA